MKNFLTLATFFCITTAAQAQVELKTNPIALLFEVVPVSVEYVISDDLGGELDILATSDGGWAYLAGKLYFSPKVRADGFHIGGFTGIFGDGYDSSGGVGFFAGYKAVSRKNVIFEVGLGLGRAFSDDIGALPYAKFHLGYRFTRKK
jgi:hypothetical protein